MGGVEFLVQKGDSEIKMLQRKKIFLCMILAGLLLGISGCQSTGGVLPKSNTEQAKEYVDIVFDAVAAGDEDVVLSGYGNTE